MAASSMAAEESIRLKNGLPDATATSIHGRDSHTLLALKSEVIDKLNKETKSLDEDNWMYEGPRSRIRLFSRRTKLISHQSGARIE